jgi:hypothetical protein
MAWRRVLVILFLCIPQVCQSQSGIDPLLSTGRAPDPTAKTVAEIHAAEQRRIPLEVYIKASENYTAGDPVALTVIVTNLFDKPLLMNSRMLVNHPRLEGELSFLITGPSGRREEIKRFVTPLSLRDRDFVTLTRGESMQRTVDLVDLFGISLKGSYRVQVCYHNEIDYTVQGHKAWKGLVWSEPVALQLH